MNKSKIIGRICLFPLSISMAFAQTPTAANSTPVNNTQAISGPVGSELCPLQNGVTMGYFNGVLTSHAGAISAMQQFKAKYGVTTPDGDHLRYDLFYNQTGGSWEDLSEQFKLKLEEEGDHLNLHWELFVDSLKGNTLSSQIFNGIRNYTNFVSTFTDYMTTKVAASITQVNAHPPTLNDLSDHRTRLDNYILEGNKLLLVAHSEGNLFVNLAYDYALTKLPTTAVKTVHIAPASSNVNGPYVLADQDLVINVALRKVSSVQPFTDVIPLYPSRQPGINFGTDILGHGIQEIYLNTTLPMAVKIDTFIKDALHTLVKPPNQLAQPGFFTVTMAWNGTGDVDLHTTEPDGTHVFYGSKLGNVGSLDVDNTVADGPEHYFATCNVAKIEEGAYKIGINNFANATGRTATVQVASWERGVLASKQLDVGAERGPGGDNSPIPVFTVNVAKIPQVPNAPATAIPRYTVTVQ